jgi:hypothetical protein
MPVFVGVMKATPLLPNESSKLNLNGGSFAGYQHNTPLWEESAAGRRLTRGLHLSAPFAFKGNIEKVAIDLK